MRVREFLGSSESSDKFHLMKSSDNFPRIPRKLGKLGQFHLMKSSDNFPRIPKKLGKLGMRIKILEFEKFHFTGNLENTRIVIRRSLSLVFVVEFPNFKYRC